jgi:parallel beta-helix repeat protein
MASMRHVAACLVVVATLALGSTTGAADKSTVATPSIATPAANPPATATVHPGGSIQAAIDAAHPGDVIAIESGTYREGVTITTPRLTIIGADDAGPVVIENPGGVDDGFDVLDGADGFVLQRVTVRDFAKNGVYLTDVDGFYLQDVTTENDGEYGIFPVLSANGVIEHCTASGHSDTGIYIGQSRQIVIRDNTAFNNVSGILIENVDSVTVTDNESYDNRGGISAVLAPRLKRTTSSNVIIESNHVHDNNHASFPNAEGLAAALPSGIGIMVLGTDSVTVRANTVTGNNFFGIGVATALLESILSGSPTSLFAGMEPTSNNVRTESNVLSANGTKPSIPLYPAADLVWDGSGSGNCWEDNDFATSNPKSLPPCAAT